MYYRILNAIRFYNPLTLTGWFVAGGSVYLLGTGFATGNAYSFLLSTVFLAGLLVLGVITRLEARRARSFEFEWESVAPLVARQGSDTQRLSHSGFRPLPFLRVHMRIRGRFIAGRTRTFHLWNEISFAHEAVVPFALRFPFSGTFHAYFAPVVRDVFGLARARFGADREKVLNVRPAFVTDRRPPNVQALQGDEDQNRMKSSDIERYFMRDYIPGDRERDINWKASSRYSQLFTRISPVTQEKTQLITIYFRPYNSLAVETIESLALLERAKSMLLFFMRSVKVAHPEYEFRVFVGNDLTEIESEEDIEQFAADIGAVHFRTYGGASDLAVDDRSGGAYIFTTACDTGLVEFVGTFLGDNLDIYRSYAVPRLDEKGGVHIRLFDDLDSFLPETLLMTKSRNTRHLLPVGQVSSITDEAVEVHFA